MLDKLNKPVVLALGYFDSVHRGHRAVIKSATEYALKNKAESVVYTFSGNFKASLGGENVKFVYTDKERAEIYKSLGCDRVVFVCANKKFLSMGRLAFLNMLNRKFNVIGYSCGKDYRFGKDGKGDVNYLLSYAKKRGQTVQALDILTSDSEKISTTLIKTLLSKGEVYKAGELLGRDYSVSGVVVSDRKIGSKLGFPTINIKLDKEKQRLLDGVYAGYVERGGVIYKAIINYGARPTFGLDEKLVEAHLIGFSGNLYGEDITVYFKKFIRNVNKFKDTDELIRQLNTDLETVKEMIYD